MHRLICAAFLLLCSQSLVAQIPPPPPPPPPAPARDAADNAAIKGKGAIRGRVTSADGGRPLRRARVSVSGGGLTEARSSTTNTSGRYEIKDLPPGRYTIRVTRSGYLPLAYGQRRPGEGGRPFELADGQVVEKIDFTLPRMGVITGRVLDELGEPVADVSVYAMDVQYYQGRRRLVPAAGGIFTRTDDVGQFRILALSPGDYAVMASARETWPQDDDPTQTIGYMPSYYPGTANSAEAQRVKVGLGQEVSAIDITLVPGRTSRISGTAVSSSGAPLVGQTVSLSQVIIGPSMSSSMGMGSARTSSDGTWTLRNVPPGDYRIGIMTTGLEERETTEIIVVAAGADIDGIALISGLGGSIKGMIVAENDAALPAGLDRVFIRARAVDMDFRMRASVSPDNGRVTKDGLFEWKGAFGPTVFTVSQLPPGWTLKGIEHEGRDITDTPIDVRHGATISGVRFVLTNRPSVVRGTLRDDRTQAPAEGTIIVFPADSSKWRDDSRWIRSARPDQNGLFEIKGLPAGDYLAAALEYIRDGQWFDPEVLEGLKSRAEKFAIGDAETIQINLTPLK